MSEIAAEATFIQSDQREKINVPSVVIGGPNEMISDGSVK